MNINKLTQGQTTVEYAVLIILLAISLLASQVYIKRAIQGKWKEAADNIGEQYDYHATSGGGTLTVESNTISNTTLVTSGKEGWLRRSETTNSFQKEDSKYTIAGE